MIEVNNRKFEAYQNPGVSEANFQKRKKVIRLNTTPQPKVNQPEVKQKPNVPPTIRYSRRTQNLILFFITAILALYFGPIAILRYNDSFAWIRSSDFLILIISLVGMYVVYAILNPSKFEFKISQSAPTIIQVPAECYVCGRTYDLKQLTELPYSRKLVCNECIKKM